MRERALVHVGGPSGSDKTALVEAILAAADGPVLAARCVRDDGLRRPRESSPRTHVELRRYLQAGAYAAAVYAFPGQVADPISFYETDLMLNYSKAVILEGDDPLGFVDLEVFVAPVPNARETLFVRRQEDVAAAQRARMDAWERTLSQPDGMAAWMEEVMGVSVWIGIQTRTARSCRQFTCATPADDKTQAASGIGPHDRCPRGQSKRHSISRMTHASAAKQTGTPLAVRTSTRQLTPAWRTPNRRTAIARAAA